MQQRRCPNGTRKNKSKICVSFDKTKIKMKTKKCLNGKGCIKNRGFNDSFFEMPEKAIDYLNSLSVDHNYIYLNDMDLEELPDLSRFKDIKLLNLVGNRLKKLPDNLPNSIETLLLSFNELSRLPDKLPNNLKVLQAAYNELKEIPKTLPNKLLELDVRENKISSLPDLPNSLRILEVSNNLLIKLPDLSNTSIIYIYADNNKIKMIDLMPKTIAAISLRYNQLESMSFIKNIPEYSDIYMYGNPLKDKDMINEKNINIYVDEVGLFENILPRISNY